MNLTIEQKEIIQTARNFIHTELPQDYTNPSEIKSVIRKLPSKKAPGLDDIQYIILKHFTKKAVVQLMYIINATIRLSHFPSHWKTGNIIPIYKPGKSSIEPSSYRPISLLPTLSKLTEK